MRTFAVALIRACLLGMVACGEPAGPEDCAADEVFATECGECGQADECIDPQAVCAPSCEADDAVCASGSCRDGACLENRCF